MFTRLNYVKKCCWAVIFKGKIHLSSTNLVSLPCKYFIFLSIRNCDGLPVLESCRNCRFLSICFCKIHLGEFSFNMDRPLISKGGMHPIQRWHKALSHFGGHAHTNVKPAPASLLVVLLPVLSLLPILFCAQNQHSMSSSVQARDSIVK